MSDEIMLVFGEDGVAREYDNTWDIVIHCESEEEQKAVLDKLNNSNREVNNLSDEEPEIIHCGDCKKCQVDSIYHDYWCDGRKVWRDHYCGYAERRTDGSN